MSDKPKRKPAYRKPCPKPPKGVRCKLCGGTYVCQQPERKKSATMSEGGEP